MPISASLREEIDAILEDKLKTFPLLPGEFKSALVAYIESSGMQLPFSQIVGNMAFTVLASVEGGKSTTSTTYVALGNGEAPSPAIPWGDFAAGGISPQFRLIATLINSTPGGTATASLAFLPFNNGDPFTGGTAASWSVSATGTTALIADSGWQDLPSLTPKNMLLVAFLLKSSSGANTATMGSGSCVLVRRRST